MFGHFFNETMQVEYWLVVKGRYVIKTSAYIFSGECKPLNCKCWVVKVVLSKERPSTRLDFLQVSGGPVNNTERICQGRGGTGTDSLDHVSP